MNTRRGAVGVVHDTEYGRCGLDESVTKSLAADMASGALEHLRDASGTSNSEGFGEKRGVDRFRRASSLASVNGFDDGQLRFVGWIPQLVPRIVEVFNHLLKARAEGMKLPWSNNMTVLR